MRNILIIGANGFTGRQLLKDLSAHKQYNVTGCSLHSDIFPALENTKKYRFIEVDIRNEASVKELFKAICPDVVINCSALSVPDYCETHHEEAYLINVTAVEQLAHLCKEYQSRFIHLSTDFVFDGKINERTGQLYTEEILPAPVNYYGFTKWKGEEKVADICSNYPFESRTRDSCCIRPMAHANFCRRSIRRDTTPDRKYDQRNLSYLW